MCAAEQICVELTSSFPPRVLQYNSSEITGSVNGFSPCIVVDGKIEQKFGETCALKCEDGYKGSPLLYCAEGENSVSESGKPQLQKKECLRTCDRSCCSNDSIQ